MATTIIFEFFPNTFDPHMWADLYSFVAGIAYQQSESFEYQIEQGTLGRVTLKMTIGPKTLLYADPTNQIEKMDGIKVK